MNRALPKKRDLAMLVDQQQTSFFKHRPSILILGISILVTCVTFIKMQELEKSRLQNEFEHLSNNIIITLKDSIENNLQVLNELNSFYAASEKVERSEFKQFSKNIFTRRPDIYMLGWSPRASQDQLLELSQSAAAEGIPDYKLKQYDHRGLMVPVKKREEYFPVFFVEPFNRNSDILGLDQNSYSITQAAMRKALETGLPSATMVMNLPQFENEPAASRNGFQVFSPVYKKDSDLTSFEDRKENIAGYLIASFHIRKMLESALKNFKTSELELRIYAQGIRDKNKLIYTYNPQPYDQVKNPWVFQSEIKVAGHYWTVVSTSTPTFKKNHYRWEAPAVFVIGILLGFLLAVYVFSFERARIRQIMVALSLTDELTQLYNRRGLWLLADEQIRLSIRHKRGFWLFVMDMDELKKINDTLGHPEGDRAIKRVAQLLQNTFRKSDIISRIGGDEFAVIAIEASQISLPALLDHLQNQLKKNNASKDYSYKLQISLGTAFFDPANPCSLDELIALADKELYAQKTMHRSQKATNI